jgi:prepilin-type N-terminal cleavage/methylation domain-containing protein
MSDTKNIRKNGFTLAEVLITLAIIGVVAALTIPTVVSNYQKTQTVTQLKKAYSALANTTNLAIADYGPVTGWEVGQQNGDGALNFSNTYLVPYLKILRNCGIKTNNECSVEYTTLDKTGSGVLNGNFVRFFTADGTIVAVETQNFLGGSDGLPYKYMIILVDLNGQKKPNTYGKDIFELRYYVFNGSETNGNNGKFMPVGYNYGRSSLLNEGDPSSCSKKGNGRFCAAVIMKDGWQIKDDYPWN